ncbi:MAG: hypothetical protein JKY87_03780 [Mariprofundus sp.]|nr:hypothetical protein [Mariprofundus sp.]
MNKINNKMITIMIVIAGMTILATYTTPMAKAQMEKTLLAMESPAEDMLDAIDSREMHKLNALYHNLTISMEELNNLPAKGNAEDRQLAMLNSWFDQISLEIEEMDDFPALANAINQFSGQLVIVTEFDHVYQKDIAWMDYLGRELLLLNKFSSESTHHNALIKVRKVELNQTWESIKLLLDSKKGGIELVKRVDPTIQSILEESDADKLVSLSMRELDLVDDIEVFFHID